MGKRRSPNCADVILIYDADSISGKRPQNVGAHQAFRNKLNLVRWETE